MEHNVHQEALWTQWEIDLSIVARFLINYYKVPFADFLFD
jgi:hypothetical protein